MQIILLRDVPGIGQKGMIKKVSDGHALNYLIPNRLAEMATEDKLKAHEKQQAEDKEASAQREKEWIELSKKLDGKKVEIRANASQQGHLYEKVSVAHLAEAIQKELKVVIPSDAIAPKMAIKQTGEWPVEIHLGSHKATITVVVVTSDA